MTADKRSVHTDALETLGNIIGDNEHRDAIHLAVEPVEAGQFMYPGQHVKIAEGKAYLAEPGKGLGIVDPFILGPVAVGQKFWLVVYPRKITSLRHVWTHPDLPEPGANPVENKRKSSMEWMESYAKGFRKSAEEFLDAADDYVRSGEYFYDGGLFEGESTPEEFWDHYNNIRGTNVKFSGWDTNFFSCAC